ncbi:hypothetical protein ACOMHN_055541 [Nucella lapillus]
MTTEKVMDASGQSVTVLNFRGHRVPTFPVESFERLDNFAFREDDVLISSYPKSGRERERLDNFVSREDDVVISAYPKSGTHWVWEIVRMLREGRTDLPVVEKDDYNIELDCTNIPAMPSPRTLCTHLLYQQLPTLRSAGCKIVSITRNPRDVAVSFYNHHVKLEEYYHYKGAWKDYFHLFVDGELDYGSWFDYAREWEEAMASGPLPPVISLSYEDMKENAVAEVTKLSQFLGKNHEEAFIQSVCDACDFASMRKRKGTLELCSEGSPIMYRKGEVGDWQNWFTPEQVARMDEVYESKMAGSSFRVRYTLEKEATKTS